MELYLVRHRARAGGEVFVLPILHGKVEFAEAVRRAFGEAAPTRVALELPQTLGEAYLRAVRRLPRITALVYATDAGDTACLMVEPADPLAEAARTALEAGLPVSFVDADLDEIPEQRDPCPDPYAVRRIGHRRYVEEWLAHAPQPATPADLLRERAMASAASALAGPGERLLLVCGLAHARRVEGLLDAPPVEVLRRVAPRSPELWHVAAASLGEAASELPYVQALYELRRAGVPEPPDLAASTLRRRVGAWELLTGGAPKWDEARALDDAAKWGSALLGGAGEGFDRQKALYRLVSAAARHYAEETGEEFAVWQKRSLFHFLRNWSLLEGGLLPDLFQLVEGARGVADDNFAYAVWRLAVRTPWQEVSEDLPVAEITAEMLRLGTRQVRFRRRFPRQKPRPLRVPGGRRGQGSPAEWLKGFDGEGICSYPPEDVVIENFGRWLKGKAARVLGEDSARAEPFRGSLLDGIDFRETIRHLPEGEIYVRRHLPVKGSMGSVVMIFDEDPDLARHPFAMTWLGEHDQESDMAFYATSPLDNVAGPGICRVEYGGFLLSYPPLRLRDVWGDPEYRWARTPAERLLAAGIDYSEEAFVVYCAPRPPRGFLRQYAARAGRRIVYVPSGTLSPVTRGKLRVMHVLDGKNKRSYAKEYIW